MTLRACWVPEYAGRRKNRCTDASASPVSRAEAVFWVIASHPDGLPAALLEMDDVKLAAMLSAQGVAMRVRQSSVSCCQHQKTA